MRSAGCGSAADAVDAVEEGAAGEAGIGERPAAAAAGAAAAAVDIGDICRAASPPAGTVMPVVLPGDAICPSAGVCPVPSGGMSARGLEPGGAALAAAFAAMNAAMASDLIESRVASLMAAGGRPTPLSRSKDNLLRALLAALALRMLLPLTREGDTAGRRGLPAGGS